MSYFEPKGIYKLIFRAHDCPEVERSVKGVIANYASGNVVIHNEDTAEITIVRYPDVIQLFKLKEEPPCPSE